MLQVKDTLRATVNLGFDGRVYKAYHGPNAAVRFANEVRILHHLEARGCPFVPKLLEADAQKLQIVTTNCGSRVEHLDAERLKELFAELEAFGVRHDDPDIRNVTYRQADGRFCLIDFELASVITPGSIQWFGETDPGKVRANNEDAFLGLQFDKREVHRLGKFGEAATGKTDFVFAVSDGMGGAKAGEFASRIAVDKITTMLPRASGGFEEVLTKLFNEIHRALTYVGSSYPECAGMEATLSLCWFTPGWLYYAHIGDSRIYYLPARGGEVKRLSQDDTHVDWLFRNGQLNEREARSHPRRNVLQKALGGENQFVDPQVGAVAYETGDIFLLCTDGLVEGLYDSQIVEHLREPESGNPAHRLVKESVAKDGRDNTTALVIQMA